MVFFTIEEISGITTIEEKGDFVMGDDVAVLAGRFEMGASFCFSQWKFPETLASGIFPKGEEDLPFLNMEEGVFFNGDEFLAGFLDREVGGRVGLAEITNGADETFR